MLISGHDDALGLMAERKDLATLIAGYSFTMLGFLAAVITVMFTIAGSRTYKKYKTKGYLNQFFAIYFVTIISLAFTALLSLFGFAKEPQPMAFDGMMIMFINTLVQVSWVALIIANLTQRASSE